MTRKKQRLGADLVPGQVKQGDLAELASIDRHGMIGVGAGELVADRDHRVEPVRPSDVNVVIDLLGLQPAVGRLDLDQRGPLLSALGSPVSRRRGDRPPRLGRTAPR